MWSGTSARVPIPENHRALDDSHSIAFAASPRRTGLRSAGQLMGVTRFVPGTTSLGSRAVIHSLVYFPAVVWLTGQLPGHRCALPQPPAELFQPPSRRCVDFSLGILCGPGKPAALHAGQPAQRLSPKRSIHRTPLDAKVRSGLLIQERSIVMALVYVECHPLRFGPLAVARLERGGV